MRPVWINSKTEIQFTLDISNFLKWNFFHMIQPYSLNVFISDFLDVVHVMQTVTLV